MISGAIMDLLMIMEECVEKARARVKSKLVILKIIAIILFVIAGLNCVLALIKLFNFISGQTIGMLAPASDFEMSLFDFSSIVDSIVRHFIKCAMYMLWGGVLLFIYHSKKVHEAIVKMTRKDEVKKLDDQIDNNEQDNNDASKTTIVCAYCSNELKESFGKCPYCGASKKIRK